MSRWTLSGTIAGFAVTITHHTVSVNQTAVIGTDGIATGGVPEIVPKYLRCTLT